MSSQLTRSQLVELGEPRPGPCVSIFMPLLGIGKEVHNDQVRISHMGDRALDLMTRLSLRAEDSRRLVEPAIRRAREETGTWNRPESSIAIFIAPGDFHSFNVPLSVPEHVAVGPRFITRPLMPLTELDETAFVLALDGQQTRLYRVDDDGLVDTHLEDLPSGVDAVARFENTQYPEHYRAPGSGGHFFHGHGGDIDTKAQLRMEFLRLVSTAVAAHVRDNDAILVLAGERELLNDFRKSVKGVEIAETEIHGSAQRMAWPDLLSRAREALREEVARRLEKLAGELIEQWSSPVVARRVAEVLPVAIQGRVRDLFIAEGAEQWGRADEAGTVLEAYSHIHMGSDDLLDLCAHHTLKNGGKVHSVSLASMPGGTEAGSIVARIRS